MKPTSTSIKYWSADDRPREKMILKGRHSLSDAELLAILISTGFKNYSAVDLARSLLATFDNKLDLLAKGDWKDYTKVNGIGPAKALTIAAALELGRRRTNVTKPNQTKVISSSDAYLHLMPFLTDLTEESFYILLLNHANEVIGTELIAKGGQTSVGVDPKVVFRKAFETKATGIILAHNHPSNQLKPSNADLELTNKLKSAAALLDMRVLDHLIVTDFGFYSMADEGDLIQ